MDKDMVMIMFVMMVEVPSKNVRRRRLRQEFRNIRNVFEEKVETEEKKLEEPHNQETILYLKGYL